MNNNIKTLYFSATGTTEKIIKGLAQELSSHIEDSNQVVHYNFTLPNNRFETVNFNSEDIVIVGIPVYAGRVPNVLLKYLNSVKSNGALAIPIVVYGNRNYDDALIELKDILETNGFHVIAAGAFVGEHSFSYILAKGRPDDEDYTLIKEFAREIFLKLLSDKKTVEVPGENPYRNYYKPKNKNGEFVDIRKVVPKTNKDCTYCKICVKVCPMGSIDFYDTSKLNGICIKCGACIKKCPVQAKYFDDDNYLNHKHELEIDFAERKRPEFFV